MANYEVKLFAKYNEGDLWARKMPDGSYKIGITDFAQQKLGTICYVDLPEAGAELTQNVSLGTIESSKTVSELISPVSGTVKAVNDAVIDAPETVNGDCYNSGWLIEVEPSDWEGDYAKLLSAAEYKESIAARD